MNFSILFLLSKQKQRAIFGNELSSATKGFLSFLNPFDSFFALIERIIDKYVFQLSLNIKSRDILSFFFNIFDYLFVLILLIYS